MYYTKGNIDQDRGGGWDEMQGRLSESQPAAPSPVPVLAMSAAHKEAEGEADGERQRCHWSTSFAWNKMVGGMVRPRALAVLRLMTRSNVVGCSTGRSAGLAPFRILST